MSEIMLPLIDAVCIIDTKSSSPSSLCIATVTSDSEDVVVSSTWSGLAKEGVVILSSATTTDAPEDWC
jgi:hypothetical protein